MKPTAKPMTRADWEKLTDMRIREAKILLDAGEWDGAYHLAGYAVECALKVCIIKRLNTSDLWPPKQFTVDCYTHDLQLLIRLADLEVAINGAGPVTGLWGQVANWGELSRYEHGKTLIDVQQFYNAITDPKDGVLQWIKARW